MVGIPEEGEAGGVTAASLKWLACPVCRAELALQQGAIHCTGCSREFKILGGLPVLRPDAAQPYI